MSNLNKKGLMTGLILSAMNPPLATGEKISSETDVSPLVEQGSKVNGNRPVPADNRPVPAFGANKNPNSVNKVAPMIVGSSYKSNENGYKGILESANYSQGPKNVVNPNGRLLQTNPTNTTLLVNTEAVTNITGAPQNSYNNSNNSFNDVSGINNLTCKGYTNNGQNWYLAQNEQGGYVFFSPDANQYYTNSANAALVSGVIGKTGMIQKTGSFVLNSNNVTINSRVYQSIGTSIALDKTSPTISDQCITFQNGYKVGVNVATDLKKIKDQQTLNNTAISYVNGTRANGQSFNMIVCDINGQDIAVYNLNGIYYCTAVPQGTLPDATKTAVGKLIGVDVENISTNGYPFELNLTKNTTTGNSTLEVVDTSLKNPVGIQSFETNISNIKGVNLVDFINTLNPTPPYTDQANEASKWNTEATIGVAVSVGTIIGLIAFYCGLKEALKRRGKILTEKELINLSVDVFFNPTEYGLSADRITWFIGRYAIVEHNKETEDIKVSDVFWDDDVISHLIEKSKAAKESVLSDGELPGKYRSMVEGMVEKEMQRGGKLQLLGLPFKTEDKKNDFKRELITAICKYCGDVILAIEEEKQEMKEALKVKMNEISSLKMQIYEKENPDKEVPKKLLNVLTLMEEEIGVKKNLDAINELHLSIKDQKKELIGEEAFKEIKSLVLSIEQEETPKFEVQFEQPQAISLEALNEAHINLQARYIELTKKLEAEEEEENKGQRINTVDKILERCESALKELEIIYQAEMFSSLQVVLFSLKTLPKALRVESEQKTGSRQRIRDGIEPRLEEEEGKITQREKVDRITQYMKKLSELTKETSKTLAQGKPDEVLEKKINSFEAYNLSTIGESIAKKKREGENKKKEIQENQVVELMEPELPVEGHKTPTSTQKVQIKPSNRYEKEKNGSEGEVKVSPEPQSNNDSRIEMENNYNTSTKGVKKGVTPSDGFEYNID